ncbi:MAG: hypothetical protein QXS92_03820 [Thermofilum sp.]
MEGLASSGGMRELRVRLGELARREGLSFDEELNKALEGVLTPYHQ